MTDKRLLLISPADNVFVLRGVVEAGETIALEQGVTRVPARLGLGHKIARHAIGRGQEIVKYGAPIGSATSDIAAGSHVHVHNVKSDYTPTFALTASSEEVPL
ncbi:MULTISPECIES: UxaA family hydrolase [unclassified Roseitalea]|uniref:UxaA family hydrolase n=1 Tax=unclassified Roseitalea TaxID=2639107 RepID=UPI00273F6706|nr:MULTISPECIES: UxaA family hydrolase [unclassified Roseitalea]